MNRITGVLMASAALFLAGNRASAQYRNGAKPQPEKTAAEQLLDEVQSSDSAVVISLEKALEIALSENVSVKVADMEIERAKYAKRGTYASLFPQVDASGSFQRTIKKQVMYMDFDMSSMFPGGGAGTGEGGEAGEGGSGFPGLGGGESSEKGKNDGGMEVGRWNTWSAGITAGMPVVNAALWESIKISGVGVELAVEKARQSKLDMVTQVKQAYFAVLLAKEALNVYKEVYDNAVANFDRIEKKYQAQKASEMEYLRAKTSVSSAIPNIFNAESQVVLALWQLKAVIGIDLTMDIDIEGSLSDYTETMFRDLHQNDTLDVNKSTTMRQLALQAEQLARTVKLRQFAYIPTLSLAFNYSYNAMTNDFKFSEYKWTPYSFVGLSLSIPIFSGGKRYHDVKQAKVQKAELDLQITDTERQLKIAIQNYLNTMETSMKSYYAAESALESAQLSYNIVNKSYELGKSTITDLNDAQLALIQTTLSKSQAVYNFVVAKCQLEQLLGADFIEEDNK